MGLGLRTKLRTTAARLGVKRRRTIGAHTYVAAGTWIDSPPLRPGYEPWIDAAYRAALDCRAGGFVDIGANLGQTLVKLLAMDPARPYVGFEPQLLGALGIRHFIDLNGLAHCRIVPVALADRDGLVEIALHELSGADESASILPELRHGEFYRGAQMVPVVRGDTALAGLGVDAVSVVKIDVEGAELEVLRGLADTLARLRPVVVFEMLSVWRSPEGNPEAMQRFEVRRERADQLTALFHAEDYRLYQLRPDGSHAIDRLELRVSSDKSLCNYAAVHAEDEARFAEGLARPA
jgi:FkbM family methyltransferase